MCFEPEFAFHFHLPPVHFVVFFFHFIPSKSIITCCACVICTVFPIILVVLWPVFVLNECVCVFYVPIVSTFTICLFLWVNCKFKKKKPKTNFSSLIFIFFSGFVDTYKHFPQTSFHKISNQNYIHFPPKTIDNSAYIFVLIGF